MNIFLSYAREDQKFIDLIKIILTRLHLESGVTFFCDVDNILPGEEWAISVSEALENANVYICLLSKNYFSSNFIHNSEMPYISRQANLGCFILPIYIDQVFIPPDSIFAKKQGINKMDTPLKGMNEVELEQFSLNFHTTCLEILKKVPPNTSRALPVRYNLVVLGKTGAGKSELINYIFGKEILKSGIGQPITVLGFHQVDCQISGVPTSIWDSAGLETGAVEKWTDVLNDELYNRGPTAPIQKWFHTVLYCVQATGSRIDPFEIEIINRFIKDRYNIILVITKCYISNDKCNELAKAVLHGIKKNIPYVLVNSTDERIGDINIAKFGISQISKEIKLALIESLIERIPARCIGLMEKEINNTCNELIKYIHNTIHHDSKENIFNHVKGKLIEINESIISPTGRFHGIIRFETKNVLSIYKEIAGILDQVMSVAEENGIIGKVESKFKISGIEQFWSLVEKNLDKAFDWDISEPFGSHKKIGEVIDGTAKIIYLPIAFVISLLAGAFDYAEEHSSFESRICAKIEEYKKVVKKDIWEYEPEIKEFFSTKIRSHLS